MTKPEPEPTRGGQPGNQNAVKPAKEKLSAKTFVFSTEAERKVWLKKAETGEMSLSEFMRRRANGEL